MSPEYNFLIKANLKDNEDASNLQKLFGLVKGVQEVTLIQDPVDSMQDKDLLLKAQRLGSLGGIMRARKLSPKQRSDIAKKAANARWHPPTS